MRAKKHLTIITAACALLSMITAIFIGKECNCIWYDIFIAIFGSALLGFIISFIEYFGERRNSMEWFYQEASIALNELRKLYPFTEDAATDLLFACFREEERNTMSHLAGEESRYEAKDALISWLKENDDLSFIPEGEQDLYLEQKFESFLQDARKSAKHLIEGCVDIARLDLRNLDNAYGSLSFIWHDHQIREDLAYKRIYDVIRKYRDLARVEMPHFQMLKDDVGSFGVCFKKAVAISAQFYDVREKTVGKEHSKAWFQSGFDQIANALDEFRCEIYHDRQPEIIEAQPVVSYNWCSE